MATVENPVPEEQIGPVARDVAATPALAPDVAPGDNPMSATELDEATPPTATTTGQTAPVELPAPPVEELLPPASEDSPAGDPLPEKTEEDSSDEPSEKVDFSDEEAALAAEQAREEGDEDEDDESDDEPAPDGASTSELDLGPLDKAALVDLFTRLLAEKPIQTLRRDAEAIKVAFYKLHRAEVEAQRKAFVDARGEPEAFEPAADPAEARLKELLGDYRRRRDEFVATLEQAKEANLKAKLEIIEELKVLVGGSETVGHTFNAFRELQQRWRETGPVPQSAVKDLWETYNHHVENFYSYIKINKELRDLDLKRNYEAKQALCEEAEALVLEPSIVTAFHKLQKLHDQWRETGPVAAEHKESVWERFREASGRINRRHQSYFDDIKEEQKKNLDLKASLCEQVEALVREPFTTRREWNRASDRLLEMQKVWKTIGFAPRKSNTRVYERFRTACDSFFEVKRGFYNQLKEEMEHNLALKNEICHAAEAISASDDWKGTGDALIAMQKRWKEIGPVPRRHSDAVWKRFRAACDAFFERKNAHFSGVEGGYKENLERKRALLAEARSRGTEGLTFEEIKEFQRQWGEVGFVPIKQKESIQKQYKEVVDAMFSALRGGEKERSMDKFRGRVASLKSGGGGGGRLRHERDRLYNKVKQLEADIATLENNIGFFGRSRGAEAMVADVREKIERAKAEMAQTIEKINLIDSEQE